MTGQPGVDHPEEQTEAEVTLTARGISVSTRVELVSSGVLVVRPSVGDYVEQVVASVGDRAEVIWSAAGQTRALPAEVLAVEPGAAVRWRLRMTGPAEVSQRRLAVRARLALPVELGFGSFEVSGETADVSEAGMRVGLDGFGIPPEAGTALSVVLSLDDGPVTVTGEVVRFQARCARWGLSIRFVDLPDRDADRLRRRVFRALREERARLAD
jgi:PilZ domain